ncbi:MAG: hypothetical protein ACP5EP_11770 [Acidobacteriaceae bacterium]
MSTVSLWVKIVAMKITAGWTPIFTFSTADGFYLIEAGTVERNFIRRAPLQAVDRGLITRQQVRNARMSGPARKIVDEALRRVA